MDAAKATREAVHVDLWERYLERPNERARRRPPSSGTAVPGGGRCKALEELLSEKGLVIAGKTPDGKFVEVAELPDHPWYVAVQYHPEFQSKPLAPHPLFADFVRASLDQRRARRGEAAPARVSVGVQ